MCGGRGMVDATSIAAATFLLNAAVVGGGLIWAVGKIRTDFAKQFATEREATNDDFEKLRAEFYGDQKVQDHNFGEMGAAMRQYITDVEKEMHKIEIWGRDNYALKPDVTKAMDSIREDIKALGADIKADIRRMENKIDEQA